MTEPHVNVPEPVTTSAKAVNASITLLGTYVTLVVSLLSDGQVTSGDVAALIAGGLGMAAAVGRVWLTRNLPKRR